jgi:hypothetical protein
MSRGGRSWVTRVSLFFLLCWPALGAPPRSAASAGGGGVTVSTGSAGALSGAAAGASGAAAGASGAPAIQVSVALPGAALTVGERAEAVITLRAPAGLLAAEPRFPEWREAWGDAEVREHDAPQRIGGADGTATFRQRLVLAAFRPGKVELARLPIAVPLRSGTVQAWTPDGLALTVRSVLPAGAKDPRPPAPLRRLPLGAPFLVCLAALAAAAAGGLWLLWRRRQRRLAGTAAGAAPLLAPYAELLAALDRLEDASSRLDRAAGESRAVDRWGRDASRRDRSGDEALGSGRSAGDPSRLDRAAGEHFQLDRLEREHLQLDLSGCEHLLLAVHTGLSQALRRYLGRTFGFPAPESTTSEIQRRLVARGWPSAQVRAMVELLRACDLVKFARAYAGSASASDGAAGRARLAAARRLAEECEARAAREQDAERIEAAG